MSRLEHDFLGELTIDDSVYYGVQTLRAMNNFHISGTPLSQFPEMIWVGNTHLHLKLGSAT